ncbi:MAG: hypothetical protein VZQ55_00140 [Ruminococcus sp.]|nr:hypothetical protein [Ruminococcus sp.]
METKNHSLILFVFILLYSFVTLFFCAGASPFIDYMGIDSSVFFTIGRGMTSGKVPYIDLFDHKGLFIYFINYFGALISHDTSWGIFLVEVIFFSIDLMFCFLIANCFLNSVKKSIFVTLLFSMFCLNYFTFEGGNFTEEYALTFQLLSILFLTKYFEKKSNSHPPFYMFIHGICAGVILFLRANMVMMWGGIGISIILILIMRKQYKNILINILTGILGVITSCSIPILYCVATKSLTEMISQSIVFNFKYAGNSNLLQNIIGSFKSPTYLIIFTLLIASAIITLCSKSYTKTLKITYAISLAFSLFSVLMPQTNYGHYLTYILPFFIPSIIIITQSLSLKISTKYKRTPLYYAALSFIFILTIVVNLRTPIKLINPNVNSRSYCEAVEEISNRFYQLQLNDCSVLVTNNNALFYNKMHVIPKTKYFYTPNIDYSVYPNAVDAQVKSILDGNNDVIVISYYDYLNKRIFNSQVIDERTIVRYLNKNYDLLCDINQFQMWSKKGI